MSESYVVICLTDQGEAEPQHYIQATRQLFDAEQAATYAAGISVSRVPRIVTPEEYLITCADFRPVKKPPARAKRERKPKVPRTRPERWADAIRRAGEALSEVEAHLDPVESAVGDLDELRQEYESWKDGLPENLSSSPLGEKLATVAEFETGDAAQPIRDAIDELRGKLDEWESADLPRGFGKD